MAEPRTPGPGAPYDQQEGGLPRWLKVTGIVVIIVLLLVVVVMLIGGHGGPRRHGLTGAVTTPLPAAAPGV